VATRRPPRKYAAYYRVLGIHKWKRLHPDIQGSKDSIIRLYQSWLIAGLPGVRKSERQIRPVPRKKVS
jgi:hypothetical protein